MPGPLSLIRPAKVDEIVVPTVSMARPAAELVVTDPAARPARPPTVTELPFRFSTPALTVSGLEGSPSAHTLPTTSVPPVTIVPTPYELEPVSVSVFGPIAAKPSGDAGMSSANVRSPAVVSMPTKEPALPLTPGSVPAKAARTSAVLKRPAPTPVPRPSVAPGPTSVVPSAGWALVAPKLSVPSLIRVPPP